MKKEHGTPEKLEYYAFMWSMARMLIAALSLVLGGPVVYEILGYQNMFSTVGALYDLACVISGVAAAYLLYLWFQNGNRVFGASDQKDTIAFFVMVVSGFNLGLVGLGAENPGLSIFSAQVFWYLGAAIHLAATYYLYTRWVSNGKRLFGGVERSSSATMPSQNLSTQGQSDVPPSAQG